ncbi:MAG: hypothetical protein COA78_25185 [Blastopirellula sp.]|nr:MAG: hypothetical protein COA78_25185 [Blastopirellula sp.]
MIEPTEQQRTNQQNRALHLWCRQLSDCLNEAGLDQRKMLKAGIDVPWNEQSVKTTLFKPLLVAMTEKDSTADANTKEFDKVCAVLTRHLATKLGVTAPAWPDARTRGRE